MRAPLRLLDGVLLDRSARAAPGRASTRPRDRQPPRRRRATRWFRRRRGVPGRLDTTPPGVGVYAIEQTRPLGPPPSKKDSDTRQTLGTCAACARRTAGYIEKTKAIFSGEREKVTVRPVDSPSRGASTSSSFDGALITFSAAGARRPVAAAQNASSSTAPL